MTGSNVLGLLAIAGAAALGATPRPPAPVAAQRDTSTPTATATLAPTPTSDASCSLSVRVDVTPRVIGVDETAVVRVDAAYDFQKLRAPLALAVVVGPIGAERVDTVRAQLSKLFAALDFAAGARVALVAPGESAGTVQWLRGPGGREEARAALAAMATGRTATAEAWQAGVGRAVAAIAAVPPSLRTALFVVLDTLPPDAGDLPATAFDGARQQLRDGLSQLTVLDIGPSLWLARLAAADDDALITVGEDDGGDGLNLRMNDARRRITALPGTFGYHVDFGDNRWASASLPPSPTAYAIGSRMGVWGSPIEAYRGALTVAFSVTPRGSIERNGSRVVPLADGSNAVSVTLGDGRICIAAVSAGELCVFRRYRRAADCGAFEAALTATAPPPTGTASDRPSPGTSPAASPDASPPVATAGVAASATAPTAPTAPSPPTPPASPVTTPKREEKPTSTITPVPSLDDHRGSAWLPFVVRRP